jgi:glycosyltransferase involved in cell wall biosynthesis
LSQSVIVQPSYIPDEEVFKSLTNRILHKRVAFIGKINYHWQYKGLDRIVDIMNQISNQFECLIIGQGNGMRNFRERIGDHTVLGFKWLPFIPPWGIPELLNQLDAVFIFESGLPHLVVSNVALEAISLGIGIITDRVDFTETYRDIVRMGQNQVMVISSSNSSSSAEMINQWIKERVENRQPSQQLVSYQEYLSANENIYANILSSHKFRF